MPRRSEHQEVGEQVVRPRRRRRAQGHGAPIASASSITSSRSVWSQRGMTFDSCAGDDGVQAVQRRKSKSVPTSTCRPAASTDRPRVGRDHDGSIGHVQAPLSPDRASRHHDHDAMFVHRALLRWDCSSGSWVGGAVSPVRRYRSPSQPGCPSSQGLQL
jgi:hypothetical protein